MLKVPIFRQAVRTADGFQTSEHKALRYSTYAYYLDRLGWEAGFEQKLMSSCARRCTRNAVDGKYAHPSFYILTFSWAILEATTTAVRDQIMRHDPNSGIFNSAYLNARVRFGIQSAVMERPSIDGLTRAFTHMRLPVIRALLRTSRKVSKPLSLAILRSLSGRRNESLFSPRFEVDTDSCIRRMKQRRESSTSSSLARSTTQPRSGRRISRRHIGGNISTVFTMKNCRGSPTG